MSTHYFHCTDGIDLIVDRAGHETGGRDILLVAHSVASEIMSAIPTFDEWSDWAVHVYDERGQVAIVPFKSEVRQAA